MRCRCRLATLGSVVAVRILGIDPGTQVAGFGCLECTVAGSATEGACMPSDAPLALRASNTVRAGSSGDLRPIECGVLRLGGRNRLIPERLFALAEQVRELIERLQPTELAIEEAFYGKSAQAALRIGEARGVVLAEAARADLAIHQYPPARIKRSVTGSGQAGKEAVAAMVLQQLGASDTQPAIPKDATDALAVALTRAEERRSPLARQEKLAAAVGEPVRFFPSRRRR